MQALKQFRCHVGRGLLVALAALAGGWAAGCVRVQQTLRLNGDGSGELSLRYGMSLEALSEMEALAKAQLADDGFTNAAPATPFAFDEAQVRKDFEEYRAWGVRLEDIRTEVSEGWKYLSLKVAFDSLEGLGRTEFLSDRRISLRRLADGSYEFIQAAPSDPEGPSPEAVQEAVADMMKGFRAELHVQVPGEIVESNADRTNGPVVSWVFDVDRDPGALQRAQKLAMRVVFRGEGLTLTDYAGPAEQE